ncbi:hypothetical protein [Novosphingobium aquimarinum]|uniref:hypothetical protein n=1 Tax=Novosphingobium aquimarinum TaxID=2682494 RepID=UPI0012EC27B0|nr:hypothetical protein [Novosphingobium aquimarinum]
MSAVIMTTLLTEPSLAREASEFVFFRQSVGDWRIEAITEVTGETERLVKDVRCQAKNPGVSITLFRSDPPILSLSYHYQNAEGEDYEVPESVLDWVEIDGRRLTARHQLIPYL